MNQLSLRSRLAVIVLEISMWVASACIVVPLPFGKVLKDIHWIGAYSAVALASFSLLLLFSAIQVEKHPLVVRRVILSLIPIALLLLTLPVMMLFAKEIM